MKSVFQIASLAYGATKRPRRVERIAEAGSVTGRGCLTSPQDMPAALHLLVSHRRWLGEPPPRRSDYVSPRRASGPLGLEARSGPARGCVRPRRPAPSPRVPRSLASPCGGLTRPAAHRQAVSGPRRPARGRAARPYAVVRRTRRRAGAVRGAAGPAVWGRRRAGPACACCAR